MQTNMTDHKILSRDGRACPTSRRLIAKAALPAALFLSAIPMAEAAIIGNIDGVVQSGNEFYINGWACDSGVSASISVHVYVGGAAGTGTGVGQAVANRSTEAAVSSRCQTTGIPHRFSIPIPVTVRREHQGEKIYVHGISQSGGSNLTITNSGVFAVPAPASLTRRYFYDGYERLCAMVEPETGTQFYQYDAAGNLIRTVLSTTAATGCLAGSSSEPTINRTYDQRGRLKALTFSDGKGDQTWTYMPDNLPASVEVANPNVANPTKTTYSYNKRRLLAGEGLSHLGGTSAWGAGYGYNANGDLSVITYPSGFVIDYAPNALGQATKAGAYASSVKYHPNGAIASFTYGNGITHTMTQNVRQLPGRSVDSGGVLDDDYGYDQNGNVSTKEDNATEGWNGRWMKYDGLDRLVQAFSPIFTHDGYANYTYDALDNIRTAKAHGNDYTYVYDAKWRLTNVTNTVDGATVIGLGYDDRGNLAKKNGQTYAFDYGNRLRSSVSPSSYWYAYDGQGRRVLSCSPSACNYQMYSQAGQLLMTQDGRDSTRTESIYLGGSLVALHELNTATGVVTAKYQHTDALGSPVAVTDASGKVIERSSYNPYGKLLNRPLKDGPGYTGHASDAVTGLSYMQQRYYDPQVGRFLSVDPVTAYAKPGLNFNRYWYANNNPYKFTDPDGRYVCSGPGKDECETFDKAIDLAKKASESSNLTAQQRKELKNAVDFFGEKGDARIQVSFGDLNGDFAQINTDTQGKGSVTFDLNAISTQSQGDLANGIAMRALHEGDHGIRIVSIGFPTSKLERLERERAGYRAEAYYQKATGFLQNSNNLWAPWYPGDGINYLRIDARAGMSVMSSCAGSNEGSCR